MARVLVTDGRQRSTLALVRSLGRRGIKVTVGEDTLPCLASCSRYAHDAFRYPSPSDDPDGFVAGITKRLWEEKYDILIPMTDTTTYLVNQFRTDLAPLARIPIPDKDAFERASDKGEMIRLARELGVPCPETHFVESVDDIRRLSGQLKYPVVIKPRRSISRASSGWLNTRVSYAGSPEDLIGKFEHYAAWPVLPIIQERVIGAGCGAFLLFDSGQPVAVFFHRRLREKPPSGGVSVLRESIPIDPNMRAGAEKLLKALNWHGVAMVEFKQDETDGQFKLMEINARFWGSLQLAIDAGIDFPYLLYRIAMGESVEPMVDYMVGIKTRWLLGDLDHLLLRLFRSSRRLNLPEGSPGRLSTLYNFLKLWQSNTKYEICKRDDFKPALHELKTYVKALMGGS